MQERQIIETTALHINITTDFLPIKQPYTSCFIFFATAQNILKFSQPILANLVLPYSQDNIQAKTKEPILQLHFG